MAIAPTSSASVSSFAPNNPASNVRQAFQQLGNALQSGDLSGAQSAYATLTQNLPPGASQNGPFAQALKQIGDALQSGDLGNAQQAMSAMQQQIQAMRAHHHHHKPEASDSSQQSAAAPAAASGGTAGSNASSNVVDVSA